MALGRATAGLWLGRGARARALLLDAISAGQVVLEDVRAARLAGLRMVVCERLSFCGQARGVQELRKCSVSRSTHLWPRRAAFSCVRVAPPCPDAAPDLPQSWERAHYFIVVRHYDCKKWTSEAVQSLISYETASRAPPVLREQKDLTKMEAEAG